MKLRSQEARQGDPAEVNLTEAISIVDRVNALCRKYSLVLFAIASGLGFLFHDLGQILGTFSFYRAEIFNTTLDFSFLTLMLAFIMLSAAARCSLGDFANLLLFPKILLLGASFIYLLTPLIALAVTLPLSFFLDDSIAQPVAIGFLLIAASPVSTGTAYWLAQLRGNIPAATAMVTFSSTLAPISMPLILGIATGVSNAHELISLRNSIGVLVLSVWLPMAFSMGLRYAAPRWLAYLRPSFDLLGMLGLLFAMFVIFARTQSVVASGLSTPLILGVLLIALVYLLGSFAISNFIAMLMGAPRLDRITLMYLTAMRSNGIAMAVGMATVSQSYPLAMLPLAFTCFHHFIAKAIHHTLVKSARTKASDFNRQIINQLKVQYQIIPLQFRGKKMWPEGMTPDDVWHRANVQDLDMEGLVTLSTDSLPVNTVVALWIEHERLSFPMEVKAIRVWEERVAEGDEIYVGGFRFHNLKQAWSDILDDFLTDPNINGQKQERTVNAISA